MAGVIETLKTYFAYVIAAIVTVVFCVSAFLIGLSNIFGQILLFVGIFSGVVTSILLIKTVQKIKSP